MFQNLHFFLLKRVFSLYFFFLPSLTAWKTHKNNTSLSCYHSKQGLSLRVCMFYVLLLPLFCKINDGHKAPKMTQLRQTISFNSHIFHAMTQSCVAWETSRVENFLGSWLFLADSWAEFRRTQIRWNTRELWILRRRRPYEDEIFSMLRRTEVTKQRARESAERCDTYCHSTESFSENVVVAKTRH